MESRFATLRQRDSSVSMLRVKLSRRLSHCQKENRGKIVNSRRQIEMLSELDQSSIMDASVVTRNISVLQEKSDNLLKAAKNAAGLDRLKQLERWKERKTLEKEKNKREKERKDIFKTGLYHPKDTFACVVLPQVPKSKARSKEVVVNVSQTSRVTRSGRRQQQTQKKEPEKVPAVKKVEPSVGRTTRSRAAVTQPAPALTRAKATVEPVGRAVSTRSARGPPVASIPKTKDKHTADASLVNRTQRNLKKAELLSGKASTNKVTFEEQPILPKESDSWEPEQEACHPTNMCMEEEEERMVKDVTAGPLPVEASSTFAPKGFLFQAPVGLSSFKFEPLTPRTAGSFLRPSSTFNLPPVPAFNFEYQAEPSSFLPLHSPPHTSSVPANQPAPISPQAPEHDVPYFRLQMVLETEKLTGLSALWEPRVEDESIPEEMRDCMRTVVGQARLLMKERFGQFSGLVDDCELGRGEKITSCTDLQGFWEMVYYQVEDVEKKFAALKEAEARDWVEELKPAAPRQKKVVKKPPTAAPSAPKPAGASAASRSRLAAAKAAAKAAMKAKKQAAEAANGSQSAGNAEEDDVSLPREAKPQTTEPPGPETVLFHGGFFQVESPAKLPGSTRKSLRLSSAVPPRSSPQHFLLKCTTPARATTTPSRATTTPARATTTTPARATTTTPARDATTTPARDATTTPARDATTTPAKDDTTTTPARDTTLARATPARATTTPARATTTPSRATTTPARATTSTPADTTTTPARDATTTPARDATTTPARDATTTPVFEAHSLSFSLSPCPGHTTPAAATDPSHPSLPSLQRIQVDIEEQESICDTPDNSVIENVPGLDFERYLRPSERCSLSPGAVAMDTLSPMAADMEIGSPMAEAGSGDLLPQEEALSTPAGLHAVSSDFTPQSKQAQPAQSNLLLFTPDLRDRIRPSMCPSDLMVFTPPNA
ncbi:unnamed protein product [Lota lota]